MVQDRRESTRWRRTMVRAQVGALCIAAAVAVIALLEGSFDDTDGRVILTSIGFGVLSATGATGVALRQAGRALALGTLTVASSGAAFATLLLALWAVDGYDAHGIWRLFGVLAVLALWSSHASQTVKARRTSDTPVVTALAMASIAVLGIDASIVTLALLDLLHDPGEPVARALAALLVVGLLATALQPLLRRAGGRPAPPDAEPTVDELVTASVDRLSAMDLPVGARVELVRLRTLLGRG
jgi:hypothetical protein